MTPQAMFDAIAYAMIAKGDSPRDLFPHARGHLIDDLERVHCNIAPEQWPGELERIATAYNLKSEFRANAVSAV